MDRVTGGAVRQVSIRGGERVDRVALQRQDGVELAHGGNGGTLRTLDLAAGEYLTQATFSSGQKDGRTRVFFAEFRTSQGRTLSAGTRTSNTVTYTAPSGWQLAGFHGRAATELDQVGLIYTPRAG